MRDILYKYAFDENDQLVCINECNKNFNVLHSYKCPNCGAIMIAKIGNGGKTPHFAHKDTIECNKETYLHKLAKIVLLRRWKDTSKDFTIKYKQESLCQNKDTCPLYEHELCKTEAVLSYNLKNAYDECYEEKKIDSFIADLLITSKKHPEKPIMVEIWVSHESSEKKKESKHRIIEIKIDSISDIISLEKGNLTESDKITYRGTFERKSKRRTFVTRHDIKHFKLFSKSGKVHSELCTCQHIPYKSSNTLFECLISTYGYDMGVPINIKKICLSKAKECGVVEKLCHNCNHYIYNDYYSKNICVLYKKHNLPREPEPIYAVICPHYVEDNSTSSWGITNDETDIINAKILVL